ncbi:MAG: TolC family protein [Burkholderiaceae bacterium]
MIRMLDFRVFSRVSLRVVVASLSWGITLSAAAQPNDAHPLQALISEAISQRADSRIARLDQQIAATKVDQARAAQLPKLDFGLNNTVTSQRDRFTGVTATADINGQPIRVDIESNRPRSVLSSDLQLTLPLYTGGRNTANKAAAKAGLSASAASARLTEQAIAHAVARAWIAVHRANTNLSHGAKQLELLNEQLRLLTVRVQRGLSSQLEVDEVNSRRAEQQAGLAQSRAERTHHWIRLCQERGLRLIAPEPDWTNFTRDTELNSALAALGAYRLPGERQARQRYRINQARQGVAAARSAYKPQLSLFAQYGLIGRSRGTEWVPLDRVRAGDFLVGARLEWNWFSGFDTDAKTREQLAQLEAEQITADETAVNEQYERALADAAIAAAAAKLAALRAREPLLARQAQVVEAQIKGGRAGETDQLRQQIEAQDLAEQISLAKMDLLQEQVNALFPALLTTAVARD